MNVGRRRRIERLESQKASRPATVDAILLPTDEPGKVAILHEDGKETPLTQAEYDAYTLKHRSTLITVLPIDEPYVALCE